jgi:Tfp pilus assembly protein PilN
MINLLPPEERRAITYARYNTQLRRWIVGGCVGLLGIVVVVLGGQMYLQQTTDDYQTAIAAAKQDLAAQKQSQTLKQVKDIQNSLKLVVSVLSREVLFSKLLQQVGQVMPKDTVLESLSLSTESETETAFDITASATNYQSASQVQVNLQDPDNKLFEKADLISITCAPASDEPNPYPCKATLRVLPAKNNPFLLLSKEAAS